MIYNLTNTFCHQKVSKSVGAAELPASAGQTAAAPNPLGASRDVNYSNDYTMYKISKLKNGLTLIKAPVKGVKALTIMAMFPVGSRYEEASISGASHFVEHMLFKGTQKRPTHFEISRELDAFGAEYNAFTSKDYTGYYIKTGEVNMEKAFDWLADIIFNSKIELEEVEKEKGAIVEELRIYRDNPLMDIEEVF